MRARKLKIANIGDWDHRGGHLFVAGYSQQDMIDQINEGYRRLHGWEHRPDIKVFSLSEFRHYVSMDCWGNTMEGMPVERGVWWARPVAGGNHSDKVEKLV